MVAGNWTNNDGLVLQFGTAKAVTEVGGDYMVLGDIREIEAYISLAQTTWGTAVGVYPAVPALPSSFSGTSTPIAAGIQSLTTLFPLQNTAPVLTASSGNGLILSAPQLWIDQLDLEVLVSANAGTGGATGLTGIGLAYATQAGASSAFAQVAPNAGVQLVGAAAIANLVAGKRWTYYPDGTVVGSTGAPTAGSWLGNVPLTTSFLNGTSGTLANAAYISAIASAGTFSGTTAAGLLRLRIRYGTYGAINQ
jgi:hypothetical protein